MIYELKNVTKKNQNKSSMVSKQILHKPVCAVTEEGLLLKEAKTNVHQLPDLCHVKRRLTLNAANYNIQCSRAAGCLLI